MKRPNTPYLYARLVAFVVLAYGLSIIANLLLHETRLHPGRDIDVLTVSVPLLIGISYTYLGSLLLRCKYNAWLITIALSVVTLALNVLRSLHRHAFGLPGNTDRILHIVVPIVLIVVLLMAKSAFQVKSDIRSFQQAVRMSMLLLLVAFLYGVGGFMLLDDHDFHRELSLPTAIHQTIDQFGLTTTTVAPHSRRARLFLDSLSTISIGALAYTAISFFQPLRTRLTNQTEQRKRAEQLLQDYPSDIDDFFKLWPHDKQYYFDKTDEAGLAYHVTRGVALVVGDPFGDPKRFKTLLASFSELCFVNDWLPCFVHVSDRNRKSYEKNELHLQKIGEEAILDIANFQAEKNNKYFRQINNRFMKLGYRVELLQAPHATADFDRCQEISIEWLRRPGRAERGFMLGYFNGDYLQSGDLAVVRDADNNIQGFMNLVRTFTPQTANYDLLRCSEAAPGNCNDFLLMGALQILHDNEVKTMNLGLCPLSGLDTYEADATLIDTTLRFLYANGDRFYSFSGLKRFKTKYHPAWEPRYIAYPGGIRNFTRALAALNRAMKVKL